MKYVSENRQENATIREDSDLARRTKTGGSMTSLPLRMTVVKIKKIRVGGELIN